MSSKFSRQLSCKGQYYREAVEGGEGSVSTVCPWQLRGEPSEGVVDGPSDDQVVVDDDKEGDHQHSVT